MKKKWTMISDWAFMEEKLIFHPILEIFGMVKSLKKEALFMTTTKSAKEGKQVILTLQKKIFK